MIRRTGSLILVVMAFGYALAGEPITIGETLTIPSKIMNEERTILVSTPTGYDQNSDKYSVLYMTDGAAHFTHTRGTVDFLVQNGLMPDVIIVSVGNTDRTRDLTPSNASMTMDDGTPREFPTSGGSAKFLKFFEKELIPYVDGHYRTQPFRLFAGHSFGGLFALNAFLSQPKLFQGIIAASPSLNWDNDQPVRLAEKLALKSSNATLFVSMADEEEGDPRPNRLDRFESAIQRAAVPGLEFEVMRMPEETHGSVVLRSHYWGLRKIFASWALPTDPESGIFTGNAATLKAHYEGLSKRFGLSVRPPEALVNQTGYQVLFQRDLDRAIEIFRLNVKNYPDSANVYDSLAEALEGAGQLQEAAKHYAQAVEVATRIGDQRLPIFTANRDRLAKTLAEAATN